MKVLLITAIAFFATLNVNAQTPAKKKPMQKDSTGMKSDRIHTKDSTYNKPNTMPNNSNAPRNTGPTGVTGSTGSTMPNNNGTMPGSTTPNNGTTPPKENN